MRYFIGKNGKQLGPFTEDQVRTQLAAGLFTYTDLGWHEGLADWKPLSALFPAADEAASAPPAMFPRGDTALPRPGFQTPGAAAEFVPTLAGRWSRLGAFIIDQFIGFLLALPGLWKLFPPFLESIRSGKSLTPEQIISQIGSALPVLIIPVLAFVIVQIVLLSSRGQNLGKILMGIRIVKLDGSNPGFTGAVVLRGFLPGLIGSIPTVGQLFTLVDILLIFREDQRCIHDLMAGTIVVEV
jgi:uncharacterized RDD family membrane protein YckC